MWPVVGLKSPKFILLETEDDLEDVRPTKTVQTPNYVSFSDWTVIIMTNFSVIKSNHPAFILTLLSFKYTVQNSKLGFSFGLDPKEIQANG